MSESRPIVTANNNNKGCAIIDWTQVPDDEIRYNTEDKEEVMKANLKERKRHKAAEQAQQEEQAWLEAKRVAKEQAKAKRAEREKAERIVWEAKEQRVHEEEERHKAKEEREAKQRCKAKAGKGDEAGAGGSKAGKVKKVVMDPGCMCCAWAQVICEFLMDGNKKQVACVHCNQSKGKCQWPGDRKDAKASPKAIKGKKRKVDEDNAEAGPSMQKWVRTSVRPTEVLDLDEFEAGGSRAKEASAARYLGLENKLDLFELHETVVENSGQIADALELLLDQSYGFRMAVSPSDSNKLCKEAEWLKTHGEDEEEESEGEDESMAEAE
ncbi:hypothetical protein M404DRAFT_18591 [Pisolithus tinctorius Marx 270]|uniref:Uncharacterized protein n=1 Tax=Pisolithus tinctorius Marx 270 TaxID=870435 RepID=A0A0C3PYT5_PISTI|nr:hypothetical protein M404DRAFT_18591 [Pisolithus tinctorius Marx 270]